MNQSRAMKRERIEKALDTLFDYPLTIVSAAMGYGKTTSVQSYLNNRNVSFVWLSLLGSDGKEDVFWRKLSNAVSTTCPMTGRQIAKIGFPRSAKQIEHLMQLLRRYNDGQPTVIVIDDYHIIGQSEHVNHLVELVVQEKISNLHMVLLSRTRPKLNDMNLVSKGLCQYLDANILAFTLQEVKDYFTFIGVSVTDEDVQKIQEYTKGWISAIYLILLGLRQGLRVAEISSINQLMESNFFSTFDLQMQNTLLNLAVLDSFTLQQAETILEDPNVPKLITLLVDQNAFIEFDRQSGVYRLHYTLQNFLREKLKVVGLDVRSVYYRAGKWYKNHGDSISTFKFYYLSGRMEELLEYLNRSNEINTAYWGFYAIYNIFNSLPLSLSKKYPFAYLKLACDFITSGDDVLVENGVEIIHGMYEYFMQLQEVFPNLCNEVLGEIEVISILLVPGDVKKIVEHAEKANELLGGGMSRTITRQSKFTFGIPNFLFIHFSKAGKLKETVDCIVEKFPPKVLDGCGAGCNYLALAEYALYTGDTENVQPHAHKAIYEAATMTQTSIIMCAKFTLMRLYVLQGNVAKTIKLIERVKKQIGQQSLKMTEQDSVIYHTMVDLCIGYIYCCIKLPEQIPEWLKIGDVSSKIFMRCGLLFTNIIFAKSVMLSKNWPKLEMLCENLIEIYSKSLNMIGLYHTLIFTAVAKYHLNGIGEGKSVLLQALKSAQEDGILLPFEENADFILPILYKLRGNNEINASYLECLILGCEQYCQIINAVQENQPPTFQEREKVSQFEENKVLAVPNQIVQIKCFGDFKVAIKGCKPIKWRTEKNKELFLFLLYNMNREISKDKIICELWPDTDLEKSMHYLHNGIYYIKKALSDYGIRHDQICICGGYMLRVGEVDYDVMGFRQYMDDIKNRPMLENLKEELDKYWDSYLEGIDYPWVNLEREKIAKEYIEAVIQLSKCYVEHELYDEAESLLCKIYQRDPYNEATTMLLMKLYRLTGANAKAARHIKNYTKLLKEDLGILPNDDILNIYNQII